MRNQSKWVLLFAAAFFATGAFGIEGSKECDQKHPHYDPHCYTVAGFSGDVQWFNRATKTFEPVTAGMQFVGQEKIKLAADAGLELRGWMPDGVTYHIGAKDCPSKDGTAVITCTVMARQNHEGFHEGFDGSTSSVKEKKLPPTPMKPRGVPPKNTDNTKSTG